jgi:hypothetical protein
MQRGAKSAGRSGGGTSGTQANVTTSGLFGCTVRAVEMADLPSEKDTPRQAAHTKAYG